MAWADSVLLGWRRNVVGLSWSSEIQCRVVRGQKYEELLVNGWSRIMNHWVSITVPS